MAAKLKGKKKSPFIGKRESMNDSLLYPRYTSLEEILVSSNCEAATSAAHTPSTTPKRPQQEQLENGTTDDERNPHRKKPKATAVNGRQEASCEAHVGGTEAEDRWDPTAVPDEDIELDEKKKKHVKKEKKKKKKKKTSEGSEAAAKVKHSGPGNQEEALRFRETLGLPTTTPVQRVPTTRFAFGFQPSCDGSDGGYAAGHAHDEYQDDDEGAQVETPVHRQQDTRNDATSPAVTSSRYDRIVNIDKDGFVPRRVYVGGMPFSYTEEQVRELWGECGEIETMDMLKFPDTKKFRGIAFITFTTEEAYLRAMEYDGDDVDGCILIVKRCTPPTAKQVERERERASKFLDRTGSACEASSEISTPPPRPLNINPAPKTAGYNVAYVGNISFNVQQHELWDLFEDYGIVKVRLHTDKETGKSKGFAHVHFNDEEGLDRSMELNGTMLMGRKIKMGYAQPKKNEM